MKRVIVTGANGFVGSHLCKKLADEGITVYAVIKDESEDISSIRFLNGIKIIFCELSQINRLKTIVKDTDTFFHLAWVGSAGNMRTNEEVQLNNALWTANALRTAHDLGCEKFVCAGSISEIEAYMAVYHQESSPAMPYIYGAGKVAAYMVCKPLANMLGISLCWATITNAYGVGEHSPRLVNNSIRKCFLGDMLQFTSATQNYDFVYIDDVADAFYLIGLYGKPNKSYTIGSGNAKPLREYLVEMCSVIGTDNYRFGNVPFTGISLPIEEFSIDELVNDCGFSPQVDFCVGIQKTAEWIYENLQK